METKLTDRWSGLPPTVGAAATDRWSGLRVTLYSYSSTYSYLR